MNRPTLLIGIVSVILSCNYVWASDGDDDHGCHGHDCTPPTKEVCFNVVCHFKVDDDHDATHMHKRSCSAASTLTKKVTLDGGEVPQQLVGNLDVKCEGEQKPSGAADITTDLLGTRFQSATGPDPALILPRGALSAGVDGQNGGHYSRGILELDDEGRFKRAEGRCFIWNTTPHH